ncbi:MAG TPA: hypothetical protein VKV95_07200 [Terriglobia bacterium]|nr:hypothetical protein [Terriglobia bacterium]
MPRKALMGLMTGLVIAATMSISQGVFGQETAKDQRSSNAAKPDKSVYRLEFIVRETEEGKRLNSRSYVMSVEDESTGMIRVGSKVPYYTGKDQFQYFDVGINIDCHLREHGNFVSLENIGIEISSVVKPDSPGLNQTPNPVVRSVRARVDAAVTPGKPTSVASIDDASSNRRFEVEVTATKVK